MANDENSMDAPIFIVGAPRSGTTLTAKILGRHSRIFMPGETHFFEDIYARRKELGDLHYPETRSKVLARLLTLYERYYEREDQERVNVLFSDETLLGALRGKCIDYREMFSCFMETQMRSLHKKRWGNNVPRDIFSIREILSFYPQAKIIVCVRDIRDFLLSYKYKWRVTGPSHVERLKKLYHPIVTSLLWKSSIKLLPLIQNVVSPKNIIVVQYGDLVQDPETVVRKICTVIGEEFEPDMLNVETHNSSLEQEAKGIFSTSIDRWRTQLSQEEIFLAERIARDELAYLGYAVEPVKVSFPKLAGIIASTPMAIWRAFRVNTDMRGPLLPYLHHRLAPLLSKRGGPLLDSRPRIVLLGPDRSAVSGVSTHINQLLGSSLAKEFDLVHVQIGSEGRTEGNIARVWRTAISPLVLAQKIFTLKPKIVHLNTSMEPKSFWRDAVYLLFGKLLRRKVVYQVHGGKLPKDFVGRNKLFSVLLRWLLGLPDAIVLLASTEIEAYQSFACIKRVDLIPNAIDLKKYEHMHVKRYDGTTIRLVYIGRLYHTKGIAEAIEAVHILRRSGIVNVTLDIAGSGPMEASLREQVQELALGDVVKFTGPLFGERKDAFWQQAHIFLFPSYHDEGLPYTVLESLASATPLITTQVGGIPDVISDHIHGMFVPPHDVEAIAEAVKFMLSDINRLRNMSAQCVKRAGEYYGVDRLSAQFSDLYKAILA